jgi:hypothetical protein
MEPQMNKIVVEHYPVSRLPEDLREGLELAESVTVTIEQDDQPRGPTHAEFMAQLEALAKDTTHPKISAEEATRRVRELRDEWDD